MKSLLEGSNWTPASAVIKLGSHPCKIFLPIYTLLLLQLILPSSWAQDRYDPRVQGEWGGRNYAEYRRNPAAVPLQQYSHFGQKQANVLNSYEREANPEPDLSQDAPLFYRHPILYGNRTGPFIIEKVVVKNFVTPTLLEYKPPAVESVSAPANTVYNKGPAAYGVGSFSRFYQQPPQAYHSPYLNYYQAYPVNYYVPRYPQWNQAQQYAYKPQDFMQGDLRDRQRQGNGEMLSQFGNNNNRAMFSGVGGNQMGDNRALPSFQMLKKAPPGSTFVPFRRPDGLMTYAVDSAQAPAHPVLLSADPDQTFIAPALTKGEPIAGVMQRDFILMPPPKAPQVPPGPGEHIENPVYYTNTPAQGQNAFMKPVSIPIPITTGKKRARKSKRMSTFLIPDAVTNQLPMTSGYLHPQQQPKYSFPNVPIKQQAQTGNNWNTVNLTQPQTPAPQLPVNPLFDDVQGATKIPIVYQPRQRYYPELSVSKPYGMQQGQQVRPTFGFPVSTSSGIMSMASLNPAALPPMPPLPPYNYIQKVHQPQRYTSSNEKVAAVVRQPSFIKPLAKSAYASDYNSQDKPFYNQASQSNPNVFTQGEGRQGSLGNTSFPTARDSKSATAQEWLQSQIQPKIQTVYAPFQQYQRSTPVAPPPRPFSTLPYQTQAQYSNQKAYPSQSTGIRSQTDEYNSENVWSRSKGQSEDQGKKQDHFTNWLSQSVSTQGVQRPSQGYQVPKAWSYSASPVTRWKGGSKENSSLGLWPPPQYTPSASATSGGQAKAYVEWGGGLETGQNAYTSATNAELDRNPFFNGVSGSGNGYPSQLRSDAQNSNEASGFSFRPITTQKQNQIEFEGSSFNNTQRDKSSILYGGRGEVQIYSKPQTDVYNHGLYPNYGTKENYKPQKDSEILQQYLQRAKQVLRDRSPKSTESANNSSAVEQQQLGSVTVPAPSFLPTDESTSTTRFTQQQPPISNDAFSGLDASFRSLLDASEFADLSSGSESIPSPGSPNDPAQLPTDDELSSHGQSISASKSTANISPDSALLSTKFTSGKSTANEVSKHGRRSRLSKRHRRHKEEKRQPTPDLIDELFDIDFWNTLNTT